MNDKFNYSYHPNSQNKPRLKEMNGKLNIILDHLDLSPPALGHPEQRPPWPLALGPAHSRPELWPPRPPTCSHPELWPPRPPTCSRLEIRLPQRSLKIRPPRPSPHSCLQALNVSIGQKIAHLMKHTLDTFFFSNNLK